MVLAWRKFRPAACHKEKSFQCRQGSHTVSGGIDAMKNDDELRDSGGLDTVSAWVIVTICLAAFVVVGVASSTAPFNRLGWPLLAYAVDERG